jgi:hypothetical protein
MVKFFHKTDNSLRLLFLDRENGAPIGYIGGKMDIIIIQCWEKNILLLAKRK